MVQLFYFYKNNLFDKGLYMNKVLKGNLVFLSITFFLGLIFINDFNGKRFLWFLNIMFYSQIIFMIRDFLKDRYLEETTKEKWKIIRDCYFLNIMFTIILFNNIVSLNTRLKCISLLLFGGCLYLIFRTYKYFNELKIYSYYKLALKDSLLILFPVIIILVGFVPRNLPGVLEIDRFTNFILNINSILGNFMIINFVFILLTSLILSFYSKIQKKMNIVLMLYICMKISVFYFMSLNSRYESNLIYTSINFLEIFIFAAILDFGKKDRKIYSNKIEHIRKESYNDIFNMIIVITFIIFSFLSLLVFNILNTKVNIFRYVLLSTVTMSAFLIRVIIYNRSKEKLTKEILQEEKFDSIRNIYTRLEFKESLENWYGPYTTFLIDLNKFSLINDILGRDKGDEALKEFGKVLDNISKTLFVKNVYGVYEGDEFLIAINSNDKKDIMKLLNKLENIKKIHLNSLNKEIEIGVNIGYSVNLGNKSFQEIIEEASFAKEIAKKEVFVSSIEYTELLKNIRIRKNLIKKDIKNALINKKLYTVYQPQISSVDNKIKGYETLIRWNHEILGPIPACDIVKSLEEIDSIKELDLYVFESTCAFQSKLIKNNINLQCSVNISINTLKNRGIVSKLDKITKKYDLIPKNITLEILEDFDLEANGVALNEIIRLKKYGFKIAIDDFGKGYSSINRLLKIPFDQIKIPKEFIADIPNDKYISMISAISNFAKSLDAELVVEGVESKEYYDFFKLLDFDVIQGFYFSKALKEKEFLEYAKNLGVSISI